MGRESAWALLRSNSPAYAIGRLLTGNPAPQGSYPTLGTKAYITGLPPFPAESLSRATSGESQEPEVLFEIVVPDLTSPICPF